MFHSIAAALLHSLYAYVWYVYGVWFIVEVKGSYEGRVFDERTLEFTIGDSGEHGLPAGLDVALMKFKRGEKSELTLSDEYGFGAAGHQEYSVPAHSTIKYEVDHRLG